jgi:hypothetical protein
MMCRSMNHLSLLVSMQFYPNNLITITEHIPCEKEKRYLFEKEKVFHQDVPSVLLDDPP